MDGSGGLLGVLLAERFAAARPRLWGVAARMVGEAEAEAALDEAGRRLSGGDLDGWLGGFVARVCLDRLRGRVGAAAAGAAGVTADSVGLAVMVVLESLPPEERLAFALREVFALGYGEIAAVVGVGEGEARGLVGRARGRVRG